MATRSAYGNTGKRRENRVEAFRRATLARKFNVKGSGGNSKGGNAWVRYIGKKR